MLKYFITLVLIATSAIANGTNLSNVEKAQREVNQKLRYEAEAGMKDNWKIPTRFADCEDYALLKRQTLIQKYGFSEEDVQIIIVKRKAKDGPAWEGHIIVKIVSLNIGLENPAAPNTGSNFISNTPPIEYSKLLKDNQYIEICTVANFSEGQVAKVTDRCKKA